jgi:hypothetical protein
MSRMENPSIPWMNLLAIGLIIAAFWEAGKRFLTTPADPGKIRP